MSNVTSCKSGMAPMLFCSTCPAAISSAPRADADSARDRATIVLAVTQLPGISAGSV